jgi:ABC-type multidrug transport system fused ATPase/permease subunit
MTARSSLGRDYAEVKRLFSYFGKPQQIWLSILVVVLIVVAEEMFEARLVQVGIDSLFAGDRPSFLRAAVTVLCLSLAVALVSGMWRYRRGVYAGRLASNMRKAVISAIVRMPLKESERLGSGAISSRLTSDIGTASTVVDPVYIMLRDALTGICAAVYMVVLDWRMGLLTILFSPLATWAGERLSRPVVQAAQRVQAASAAIADTVSDSVSGVVAVKAFNLEAQVTERLSGASRDALKQDMAMHRLLAILEGAIWFLAGAPLLVPFGIGGYMAFTGAVTPGVLIAILKLSNNTRSPLVEVGNQLGQLRKCIGSGKDILELLGKEVEPELPRGSAHAAPSGAKSLHGEALTFRYPDRQEPALIDVSISVPAGRLAFLLGASGSGKSTLLKILGGLYEADSGRFLAGGPPDTIYVPQTPTLFPWTLKENLTCGNPLASDAEIHAALVTAQAEFCEEYLDRPVLSEETPLSVGQKYRLCVARALLCRPPILLLDEPCASLDATTEENLINSLRQEAGVRTVVIATHRLSQIRDDDLVFVMEEGRVAQSGAYGAIRVTPVTSGKEATP